MAERPDVRAEVREELEGHLALRMRDNLGRGLSPDEARTEAERRLGRLEIAMTASTRIRARGYGFRRSFAHDIRQAWLAVRRSPRLTIVGLLVTAVGLTTAFASARVADALMGRAPAGIRDAGELLSMRDAFDGEHPVLMSYALFEAIRRGAPDLEPFVWSQRSFQVKYEHVSGVYTGAFVSGAYFPALRTGARAGRLLGAPDEESVARVAVVSHRLAEQVSPDRPAAVVGRSLVINGQSFSVIGVAQRLFHGIEAGYPADLWVPLSVEPELSTPRVRPDGAIVRGNLHTGAGWLRGAVRAGTGTAIRSVADRLTVLTSAVLDGPRPRDPEARIALDPLPWISPFEGDRDRITRVLEPVGWAVLLTVLLTGACLSGLVVGRLSERRQELGIRAALGAGIWRLRRQTLLEIGMVVVAGSIVAAAASEALLGSLARLQLAAGIAVGDAITPLDTRAAALLLLYAACITAVAGAASLAMVSHGRLDSRADSTRVTTSGTRLRRVLIAAQVAVGCALLSGAVLLTRSLDALRAQPLGFEAASVAYLQLNPAADGLESADLVRLADRLLHATAVPSASHLAIVDEIPYTDDSTLYVFGEKSEESRAFPLWASRIAGPYFETLGVRLTAGRPFTPADAGRPVAIVSDNLAEVYWPGMNPVGRFIRIGGERGTRHEIVGVVPGLRDRSWRASATPRAYLPFDERAPGLAVVARAGAGGPGPVISELVQAAARLDSRLVTVRSGSMLDLAARTIEQRVLFRFMTVAVGVGSLLMVAAGVWGLTQSTVRRRWRELGIRQALGARSGEVLRRALADAWFVMLIGGGAGLLGSWQFGRVLRSWLFGIEHYDPLSLGAAIGVVLTAVLAGALVPARAAGRIDVSMLLRQD